VDAPPPALLADSLEPAVADVVTDQRPPFSGEIDSADSSTNTTSPREPTLRTPQAIAPFRCARRRAGRSGLELPRQATANYGFNPGVAGVILPARTKRGTPDCAGVPPPFRDVLWH
jgi:hypothetical protein